MEQVLKSMQVPESISDFQMGASTLLGRTPDRHAHPRITLFTIPKAFRGHAGMIQANAVESWTRLGSNVQVVLCGDELGVREVCSEKAICQLADLQSNQWGTPLLSDAFRRVPVIAPQATPYFAYTNSDIIFVDGFNELINLLPSLGLDRFLMIGRRTDVDIDEPIDFSQPNWRAELRELALSQGRLAPVVCKDFFLFPSGMYQEIPDFAVGRGNWDNWMVANALANSIPVIDVTQALLALHQNHDHEHVRGGKRSAYLTGKEARSNAKLGGGSHVIRGAASTFQLTKLPDGWKLQPTKPTAFWKDLPKFVGLVRDLIVNRSS
jgi:hypothetical protein